MAYATVEDMILLFGAEDLAVVSAARGEPADSIDRDKISDMLARASDEMDSWLRRHYRVPVSALCTTLTQHCCAIARYRLFSSTSTTTATEQMRTDFKDALSWLRSVNEGRVTLDGATPANTPGTFSSMQARPPVFGLDGPFG